MAPRQWTKTFETGHPVIDGQHIKIFGFLDKIESLLTGDDGDATVATCKAFRAFMVKHFADEEDILRQAEFPRLRQHMEEHSRVMGQMKKFFDNCNESCRTGNADSCMEDLSFHTLDHIIRLDLGFKSHLQMKKMAPDR